MDYKEIKMNKDFYNIKELSEELGIHSNTCHKYIRAGKIKAVLIGNKYRVYFDEVARIKSEGFSRKKE
jgi:excisionase family DNA binding protein